MIDETFQPTTLIIDGMNFAYTAFYSHNRLSYKGKPTSIIFGMPQQLAAIMRDYKTQDVFIVWDGDRHPKRLELCPTYKSHREEKKTEELKASILKQCKTVQRLFKYMGIAQVRNELIEGDDMIYILTKKLEKTRRHIVICSGDKDMEQLIKPGVSVYNIRTKEILREGKLFEAHRTIKPTQVSDYLCLVGDKSDDIPGYNGMGPVKSIKFLTEFGSIKNFLSNPKNKFRGIDRKELKRVYKVNKYMINLKLFNKKYNKGAKIIYINKKRKGNLVKFTTLCQKYNLKLFMMPKFKSLIN